MSDKQVNDSVAVQETSSEKALADLILSGRASEQEKGLALRAIQVGMASNMVAQINALHSTAFRALDLYRELDEAYLDTIREQLQAGSLTKDEIRLERNALEQRMTTILNLERQIVQGKSLFPMDAISEDDRKVLRLMASVKTPEERKKFFKAIDDYFQSSNSFDDAQAE